MKTYLVEIATTDRVDVRTVIVTADSVVKVATTLAMDPEFSKRYRVDQIHSVVALEPNKVTWV